MRILKEGHRTKHKQNNTRSQGPGIVLLKPWRYTSPRAQLSGVQLAQSNALRKTLVSPYFKGGHRTNTKIRTPRAKSPGIFYLKPWRCPTFTWGNPTLSSALSSFTSEFEMGSGGSHSLWPPGKLALNYCRTDAPSGKLKIPREARVLHENSESCKRLGLLHSPYQQRSNCLSVIWSSLTVN